MANHTVWKTKGDVHDPGKYSGITLLNQVLKPNAREHICLRFVYLEKAFDLQKVETNGDGDIVLAGSSRGQDGGGDVSSSFFSFSRQGSPQRIFYLHSIQLLHPPPTLQPLPCPLSTHPRTSF